MNEWTEQENAYAIAMWKAGKRASDIGRELGRTRNAVIGRMHRMGIVPDMTARLPIIRQPIRRITPYVPPPEGGVTFAGLEDNMCRWSIDTGRYCGLTALPHKPYCATHAMESAKPLQPHVGRPSVLSYGARTRTRWK